MGLKRRTPLKSKTPLRRFTRLRPVSKKRQAIAGERRELVRRLLELYPKCQFPVGTKCRVDGGGCTGYGCPNASRHVHERLSRGRGGSILDEDNCIPVCESHHRWVHANPDLAEWIGVLTHSWDASPDASAPLPRPGPEQSGEKESLKPEGHR